MDVLHGLAAIAAIILTLELVALLVVPAFLVAFLGRKGMTWLIGEKGKYTWAVGLLHTVLDTAGRYVRRGEDIAVTPIIMVGAAWNGAGTTLRSLRRRADQPLSRLRRSS